MIIKEYPYAMELFLKMAATSSPSYEEKSMVDLIIDQVHSNNLPCEIIRQQIKLSDLDADVLERISKENQAKTTEQLQLVFAATDDAKEPIFFCAHIDTVNPAKNITPIIDGDKIRTDGSTVLGGDDKAGVAGMLAAMKYVVDNNIPHGKVVLLFDALEEEGLLGARMVDINKFDVKYGFVLDTTGSVGRLVERVQHSKLFTIDLEVKDIPNHAKSCLVDNALTIASEIITKLPKGLYDKDDYTFSQVTKLNLESQPGYMVPYKATITATLRSFVEAELNLLVKQYTTIVTNLKYDNTTITYKCTPLKTLGYNHSHTTIGKMMMKKANEIFAEMNIKSHHIVDGLGGHDASIFVSKGIPTLVLACGMQDIHTTREWIYIEDIHNTTHTLVQLIKKA